MKKFLVLLGLLFGISPVSAQTIKSFSASVIHGGDVLVPGGATFQAQNRLIVRTVRGCYASYLYKMETVSPASFRAGLWFSPTCEQPWTLLDSFGPYNGGAPSVLADESGDIFWLITDDNSNLFMRKYACGADPICLDRTQRIWPGYASTKFTSAYSEHCQRFFVSSWAPPAHTFSIFDRNMNLVDSYAHAHPGSVSYLHYPWVEISQDIIAGAWVTSPLTATTQHYDDIRYMLNNSCGARAGWYSPHTGASAAVPFIADASGPSAGMRAGFTPSANSVWPDAMTLTNRLNLHVSYSSPNGPAPTTQTEFSFHNMGSSYYRLYMHDNLMQGASTSKVGGASLTIQSLRGSSGCYFKGGDGALYLLGPSREVDAGGKNWINALKSTDDGVTWQDFAQSSETFNIYALNCMRQGIETAPGVWLNGEEIVGLFTDITSPGLNYPQQVKSFHIPIN